MQPPSEADVIAATESLKRQKLAVDNQTDAMQQLASVLEEPRLDGDTYRCGWFAIDRIVARILRAYREERLEHGHALGAAIYHNERALQAHRSGIVLPTFTQRKPNN